MSPRDAVKDFVVLNVPGLLSRKVSPNALQWKRLVLAFTSTQIDFYIGAGLLTETASARTTPKNKTVLMLSDFTHEGQQFLMSGGDDKWLASCDRKSSKLLARGAPEDQILAVYRDASGLNKRLNKFRTERAQLQ